MQKKKGLDTVGKFKINRIKIKKEINPKGAPTPKMS